MRKLNWKIIDKILLVHQAKDLPESFEEAFDYVLLDHTVVVTESLFEKFEEKTIVSIGKGARHDKINYVPSKREALDFIEMDKIEKLLLD